MKCDELKAYGMADPSIDDEYEMYKVAEVDAAIAELKEKLHDVDNQWNEQCKEIAQLKAENEQLKAKLETVNDDKCAELRRQKFKRCLAMAKWCEDKIDTIKNGYMVSGVESKHGVMTTCPPECNPKFSFYKRWHKRWLKLAEKFKEAK